MWNWGIDVTFQFQHVVFDQGLDSAELVGQLRAAHAKGTYLGQPNLSAWEVQCWTIFQGQNSFGLEFNNGTMADMSQWET